MKNKTTIVSTILCILPIILSIVLYDDLPARIAIHFDNSGNADNYLPKAIAAFGLPLFFAAVNLYSHFRQAAEPKAGSAPSFLRALSKWSAPVLSIVLVPVTLFLSMGKEIPIIILTTSIVGAAVIISGNYLPKCKTNYSVGIKLPWTLNDENNWNRTHRFAGFIWVTGGAVIIINGFIQIPYLMVVLAAALVLLPFVYSYFYYHRHRVLK